MTDLFRSVFRVLARTTLSLPLALLSPIEATEGSRINLVYTGQTRSVLEPPAGNGPDAGDIARRATVLRVLNAVHRNVLTLDAGGLFGGDRDVDRARNTFHRRLMDMMGYQAARVGTDALKFGTPFLDSVSRSGGMALVCADLWSPDGIGPICGPFRIYRVGDLRVGVIGISGPGRGSSIPAAPKDVEIVAAGAVAALRGRVDFTVLLSGLDEMSNRSLAERVAGIDVILASSSAAKSDRVNETAILGAMTETGWVGRAAFDVGAEGSVLIDVERIDVTPEIIPDEAVSDSVIAFYERFASGTSKEAVAGGRFVGSATCGSCHAEIHRVWSGTPHARAYQTLLADQSHFSPQCLPCHTTGYLKAGGFGPRTRQPDLVGVGCESCHGPGYDHVRRPLESNTTVESGAEPCRRCHTREQSPSFTSKMSAFGKAAHHGAYLREPSRVGAAASRPVRVELFVMPECPYGIQAESVLIPAVRRLGDKVDFRLHFIAEPSSIGPGRASTPRRSGQAPAACEGEAVPGIGRFRSLHGDREVAEGVRQAVMSELDSALLLEYVMCRGLEGAGGANDAWEACAAQAGFDPVRIASIAEAPRGKAIYAKNVRRAHLMGVRASPTMFIDGVESTAHFDPEAFLHAVTEDDPVAEAAAGLPECVRDRDCAQPGKVGRCADPGSESARCIYTDPVAFDLTVVNDPACPVCDTGFFLKSTLELFPGARVRNVGASTAAGRSLVDRYGLFELPAFLFGKGFERAALYSRFKRLVVKRGDVHLPAAQLVTVRKRLDRPPEKGRVDLFLSPGTSAGMRLADRLLSWAEPPSGPIDVRTHFRPGLEGDDESPWHVCVRDLDQAALRAFISCRAQGTLGGRRELTPDACLRAAGLDPDRVARCATGGEADSLFQADRAAASLFGLDTQPHTAVVIDGCIVIGPAMAARAPEIHRRIHAGE